MYQCSLQISVFSNNSVIGETVRRIPPLEHFSHCVIERTIPDPQLLLDSQVVIWNLGTALLPAELRSLCKKEAVLIYCGEHERIGRFEPAELEAADEFWDMPFNRERVRICMEHIFKRIKLEYDLYMTRTYLDTAIDSLPDMMWFKALDGTHVKVNKAFCSVVGKSREDVTGQDHCYIWGVSPDDIENGEAACRESEEAVMKARRTLQFTEEVKCSRGMRQLRTYKTPIIDRDGVTILGTVGIGHDVTDLGNMSTEIEILLQSMPYAILLWNKEGRILNVNAKFEEYFQTDKTKILDRDYEDWIAEAFEEPRTINNEGYVEARVSLPDDSVRMLEVHENIIYDIFHNVVGKLCIFRDVTVERSLEKKILHSSNTDFLTGLYNRRCFYKYILNNRDDKTVSLLYIDLDCFKEINDTYGHKVGDAVLIHTAEVLMESFREDFVTRLGGDEFLVVRLGDCSIRQLEMEAGSFLKEIRREFQAAGQAVSLSASVGIAQSSDANIDIDLLIQRSDQALYRAKNDGRNRYCVYGEDE
ncbi:diguanylate cyclase [Clostridium sp. AM58-1XD]|uniref:sensor domain-containing diguanylate cyclase n=1 Tax=Clostridium sp. AM58-1XD TaxID=2292307 RepID=UPI000E4CDCB6|nr:diguanylate cyclase [Clostridium sp. AM58-1XD]RGY95329.1 diguanylate cyclase [Clostridium sp. AM58-1XD]